MAGASQPLPYTLRDYAVIADGERGAVIGPEGAVAWMCFPRWHDPSLFTSLVGGDGFYAVTPTSRFVWGGYYEEGSLIWRSRWVTTEGVIECRTALVVPARPEEAVLLRRVTVLEGTGEIRVILHARGGYGEDPARRLHRHDDDAWTALAGPVHLRWTGAAEARAVPDGHGGHLLTFTTVMTRGDHRDLVLELGEAPFDRAPPDPDTAWFATERHWNGVVPAMESSVARRDARHAYAVLSGLTSSRTRGMVAGATTSLPERAELGRNYDYRYVWIRDQCFSGQATAALGPHSLLDDAVTFVRERLLADGSNLAPAYTIDGNRVPDERPLDLPGYPGGTDRVGNHVNAQFQLDIFGEALLLFAAAAAHDHLDVDGWRAVETAVDAIATRWMQPDAGIWELAPARWAHSMLECVAGLRAISSDRNAPRADAARWMHLAETILADVSTTCVHASGRWQRAPDDDRVDAALLLPAMRGGLASDDPRTAATIDAVCTSLSEDGYVYRFRHDSGPLGLAEGAFLLCGFWMSLVSLQQGDAVQAARWFERNRAACGSPGLFCEEFDVGERELRGNLPQAFVHAALLECSARQSRF